MIAHRYSVWKEKPTSRPALIITNDGGNKYQKVAVFTNEESVEMFNDWLQNVLIEFARQTQVIGGAEDE